MEVDRSDSTPHASSKKEIPHRNLILLIVFLDIFGVGLAMPLVTPLIKQLGASPVQVGLLSSVYGAVQLVTGPFMGLISDRMGRRIVILMAYLGSMAGYFILGLSSTLQLVILSRVVTGCLKHSQNAVKAYVADHTTNQNRAVEFGRMATASGLGIMIGPAVGGFLHKVGGFTLPIMTAGTFFFIDAIIVTSFLPPDTTSASPKVKHSSSSDGRLAWLHQALPKVSMLARPRISALFVVRLLVGMAVMTFRQGISLLVIFRFNLNVRDNGLLISYQGALASLVQGFAIRPLVQFFDSGPLMLRAMALLGISFAACALSPNVAILALFLTPVALSSGVLRTTFAALLTSVVPQDEVGQILGLSDAAMSMCRVVGPSLAGAMASWIDTRAPCLLSGAIAALAAALFFSFGCASEHSEGGRVRSLEKEASDLSEGKPLLLQEEEGQTQTAEVTFLRSRSWNKSPVDELNLAPQKLALFATNKSKST